MLASLLDPVGSYKKNDSLPRRSRLSSNTVLTASTVFFLAACVVFLLFAYDRGPVASVKELRSRSVELDEDGNEICHVPAIRRPEEFFDDIELVTGDCASMVQMGKTAISEVIEDDWGIATRCNESAAHFQWVCLDKRLKINHRECLVYSVGVDADFPFEVDMEKFGCEVFAFDTEHHDQDFQHSDRIWFQNVRIGSESYDAYLDGDKMQKVRSLHLVIEKLGHQNRVIDVLKLDVRDQEWEALKEFVHSDVMDQVKQLVVTLNFHRPRQSSQPDEMLNHLLEYYQLLRMLDCDGFRVFSSKGRGEPIRAHGMKRTFYPEYEISYINTNFFQ